MSSADVDTLAKGWLAIDYVDSTRTMIEVAAAHFLSLPTFRRLSTPLSCLDLHTSSLHAWNLDMVSLS
jgi:hypothetical protein